MRLINSNKLLGHNVERKKEKIVPSTLIPMIILLDCISINQTLAETKNLHVLGCQWMFPFEQLQLHILI